MNFEEFLCQKGGGIMKKRTKGIRWIHYFPIAGMEKETMKPHKIFFFVTKIT